MMMMILIMPKKPLSLEKSFKGCSLYAFKTECWGNVSLFVSVQALRRKNDQLKGRQSASSDSQQTVRRPHWCQPGPCQYGLWHWPRKTSYSQDAHIPNFTYPPLSWLNYSSLKYVCTICICMYKTLLIGLEHINQKRWAIPHCVLESYIVLPEGCNEINQVQVLLFDKPTVRAWWSCQTTATAPTCWHSRLGDAKHQPSFLVFTDATSTVTLALGSGTTACICKLLWSATHWHLPCLLTHRRSFDFHSLVRSANAPIRVVVCEATCRLPGLSSEHH